MSDEKQGGLGRYALSSALAFQQLIEQGDPTVAQQVRLALVFAWEAGWYAGVNNPEGENPFGEGAVDE